MESKEKFNQNMKAEVISDEDVDKINGGLGIVGIGVVNGEWKIRDTLSDSFYEEKYSSREEAVKAAKLAGNIIRTKVWSYDRCGMPVCGYEYDEPLKGGFISKFDHNDE